MLSYTYIEIEYYYMKFFESHFTDYVHKVDEYSLHPSVKKTFATFPRDIQSLPNIIIYGPSGVGKYSHALSLISRYSPSRLKYEKRIAVAYNKDTFFMKISDCHFEVDMSLLGCNSKHLWNEIYNQIQDIVSARPMTHAFVMCKNFHKIHSELLETFYSYMLSSEQVSLHFIIISDHISFIPDNILQRCKRIPFRRPTHLCYNKCLKMSAAATGTGTNDIIKIESIKLSSKFRLETITNIKALKSNITELTTPHENICNNIIRIIRSPQDELKYDELRECLYDLLTYDINIQECVWYILQRLIMDELLLPAMMNDILLQVYVFLQYFNNNYRPIYHLENFVLLLVCKIHGYKHNLPPNA
jgi:DNA polymerase III delta prime subunit